MGKTKSARSKVYFFLGGATVVVSLIVFLSGHFGNDAQASEKTTAGKENAAKSEQIPVELAPVTRGEMISSVSATSNLRALREVEISSQAEGVVEELQIEEGDQVQAGQVLCVFNDSQLQIRLQSSRQKLAQARLQLEKARIQQEKTAVQIKNTEEDLNRYEQLYKEGLVSEREVAQYKYRREELEHDSRVSSSQSRELEHRVQELEAEGMQVDLEISRTRVRAPFSGCVVQRMAEIGRTVRTLEPLFKIGTFTPLYADVHFSEAEARLIHPRQEVLLQLGSDETRKTMGRVLRLSPVVDQASGTVKVTVELDHSEQGFLPGSFVRVQIQTERRQGSLLIPKRAMLEEDGEAFVFITNKDQAKRTVIKTGHELNGQVEVLQGLAEGQQVIVAGQGSLKDGMAIRVIAANGRTETGNSAGRPKA